MELVMRMMIQMIPAIYLNRVHPNSGPMKIRCKKKKKKHTIDFDLLKGKEVRALGVYGCACVRACMRQLHYIFPEVV